MLKPTALYAYASISRITCVTTDFSKTILLFISRDNTRFTLKSRVVDIVDIIYEVKLQLLTPLQYVATSPINLLTPLPGAIWFSLFYHSVYHDFTINVICRYEESDQVFCARKGHTCDK
jgi:hypothetical protein